MTPSHLAVQCALGIACVGGASCSGVPRSPAAELDWRPRLDQPIRQLEEVLEATEQQQPRNYTVANLAWLLDAKLYFLFQRYVAALPARARPAAVEEQRRWLARRTRATEEAYAEYEGGTLAPYAGGRAFVDVTKERLAELDRRLPEAAAP